MLNFKFVSNDIQKLNRVESILSSGKEELMHVLGATLMSLVSDSFESRSRGKAHGSVKQWEPLRPYTVKKKGGPLPIGIDTGRQRNSLEYGISSDNETVTVEYKAKHSKYFDGGTSRMVSRPLIPRPVPREWINEMEQAGQEWLNDVMETHFGGPGSSENILPSRNTSRLPSRLGGSGSSSNILPGG